MARKGNTRELTKHLRELALEASDEIGNDGAPISKAHALAMLIWKRALGYSAVNDKGDTVTHPSEVWAINLVYERLEGKVANAATEESTARPIHDRVSDLHRDRINSIGTAPKTAPKLTFGKPGKPNGNT